MDNEIINTPVEVFELFCFQTPHGDSADTKCGLATQVRNARLYKINSNLEYIITSILKLEIIHNNSRFDPII